MIKAFWNWFAGPEADARRLNRDAGYIVHSLSEEHYGPIRADVAKDLRQDIDYVFQTFIEKEDPYGHKRAEDHLKRMHGEARRRRDQRALTALTLAIIYVRGDRLGDLAAPAREAIDDFLDHWAPRTEENSGVIPPTGPATRHFDPNRSGRGDFS